MAGSLDSPSKRQTLNLRIPPGERELIDRAARIAGKNRTEFILDASRRAAEDALLDQALMRVDSEAFAAFQALLDAPPAPNDRLRKTMQSVPPWDES
jgi:uncharacterized protein (DUF1778 family)